MKGIELLSLTDEQKKLIQTSEINYKRFAHILFSIVSANESEIVVKVWQKENDTGKYLTSKELIDRTKEVFGILPQKIHVRPIPFQTNNLESYNAEKVEKDMHELGLQAKDLVKLTGLDKSSLSRLLNQGRELTKIHKAMFYYLFKYLKGKENGK